MHCFCFPLWGSMYLWKSILYIDLTHHEFLQVDRHFSVIYIQGLKKAACAFKTLDSVKSYMTDPKLWQRSQSTEPSTHTSYMLSLTTSSPGISNKSTVLAATITVTSGAKKDMLFTALTSMQFATNCLQHTLVNQICRFHLNMLFPKVLSYQRETPRKTQ